MTDTTTTTELPYCVTITKPGMDTVHLGFVFRHQAEQAAGTLRFNLFNTAHPEGTAITWGSTPNEVTPLYPVPTDSYALSQEITTEVDDRDERYGANYPDLYARLQAQEGVDQASKLWRTACALLDDDADSSDGGGPR